MHLPQGWLPHNSPLNQVDAEGGLYIEVTTESLMFLPLLKQNLGDSFDMFFKLGLHLSMFQCFCIIFLISWDDVLNFVTKVTLLSETSLLAGCKRVSLCTDLVGSDEGLLYTFIVYSY